MTTRISTSPYAWLLTDVDGRIDTVSSGARALLGVDDLGPGDDLLTLFLPRQRKHLLFDIDVALTGWPTQRIVTFRLLGLRSRAVRYRVSRRLKARGVGLLWQFDAADAAGLIRCA